MVVIVLIRQASRVAVDVQEQHAIVACTYVHGMAQGYANGQPEPGSFFAHITHRLRIWHRVGPNISPLPNLTLRLAVKHAYGPDLLRNLISTYLFSCLCPANCPPETLYEFLPSPFPPFCGPKPVRICASIPQS